MSAESVKRSIQFLDDMAGKIDFIPVNWREKIDLDDLDMISCERCVLGQLWKAAGNSHDSSPYDDAYRALRVKFDTSAARFYHLAFSGDTAEWRKQLTETVVPREGEIFYQKSDPEYTRTILSAVEQGGKIWISFTHASPTGGSGARTLTNVAFEFDKWTTDKPARFKNGDQLLDAEGRSYYYFSDKRVIRVGDGVLGWADLAFYERQDGPLAKVEHGGTKHYFSNTFFKLDK